MNNICVHAFVDGLVQGVWFRKSTQGEANRRNITGFAKNLPDGRVEVLLCGEEAAVRELEQWLQQGPSNAQVTSVESEDAEWQFIDSFET